MFFTLYNKYCNWSESKTEVELLKIQLESLTNDVKNHLQSIYKNQMKYDNVIKTLIKNHNRRTREDIEKMKEAKEFNLLCPTALL